MRLLKITAGAFSFDNLIKIDYNYPVLLKPEQIHFKEGVMEKGQIIMGIAYLLSKIESGLRVKKIEANGIKQVAVKEWEKTLVKDIESFVEDWKKPIDLKESVQPLAVTGQFKNEKSCFFKWVHAETKEERLTFMIYEVSFMKRKFFDLEPDWKKIKEALSFLDELISDLESANNQDQWLQEQITMLKNGELLLRQQSFLPVP
jgi:hypothetical protein